MELSQEGACGRGSYQATVLPFPWYVGPNCINRNFSSPLSLQHFTTPYLNPPPQAHTPTHFCQILSHLLLERYGAKGIFECPWMPLVPSQCHYSPLASCIIWTGGLKLGDRALYLSHTYLGRGTQSSQARTPAGRSE
jgi:hypothetical protein